MSGIRIATDDDLDHLAAIEDAADALFIERFQPASWDAAPGGRSRAARPGWILVLPDDRDEPVGFVHVAEVEGGAHLEQLSVHPSVARRGHGGALLRAALVAAARRGHTRMTLRTDADVPWNGPFYARHGFVETDPDTPFLSGLVDVEDRLGLSAHGRRIQMTARMSEDG